MDAMNTGLYQQRRPQMSGLLPDDDFQYGEYDGDLDASASHPIFTFDGLPALSRSSSQHLMNSSSPASSNILSSSYSNLMQPIPMSQPSISWTDPSLTSGGFQENHHSYGGYSASNINGHNGSFPRGAEYHQPRYMSNLYSINDNNMCLEESFAPSYILDSNRHGMQHSPVMSSPFDHQHMSNARDFQRMSISNSPVPKMEPEESRIDFSSFSLPSSEASDEGNTSREMTAAEVEDQNEHHPEEPYAKLIHRALMSVPTKSMVLQEIYQWFRDNTQKGKMDSSKGWMNSIRHNLSMNAAFKKTERKTPDNDSKKSTEWVLEEFAIRDGVQSTTRYRRGNGTKKSGRSDTPSLARVVSGRRGGMSTKQAKLQQQRQQRVKDERRDSSQRVDSMGMRGPQFPPQHHLQHHAHHEQRQRSPLTPPSAVDFGAGPFYFGAMKVEPEQPYDEMQQMYRLEDVRGCVEGSPLFSNGADAHFQVGQPLSNHHY